jgi:hypothetical protein
MDILTRIILDVEMQPVKAAKVKNQSPDQKMLDKQLDSTEKEIKKTKDATMNATKAMKSMPAMESKIDKLTLILLEHNCGKGKTWNSLKNKCTNNPPYDEEQDEETFGIFAGRKNAVNYK